MNQDELAVGYLDVISAEQSSGEASIVPLDDVFKIEGAIAILKQITTEIDKHKQLKKKRTESIDKRISQLSYRETILRKIVLSTLNQHKQKSISFPGIGKVVKGSKKGTWVINDEEKLFDFLKEEKEYKKIVENKPTIKKKELNKLLSEWKKIGKTPDSVEQNKDEESISVTFDKDFVPEEVDVEMIPVPVKKLGSTVDVKDLAF